MATKKPIIKKLLFFSPYFYPYISGLTQYPYRLFTESGLPLQTTCLTFRHSKDLRKIDVISNEVRNLGRKVETRHASLDFPALPAGRSAMPRNDKSTSSLTILHMPFLFRVSKGFISPQSLSYFWNETRKHDIVMINLPSIEGIPLAFIALLQRKPVFSLLHCEVLLPFSLPNTIINFFLNCGVFLQLLLSKKIIVYTKDYYEKKWIYSFFKNKMEVILPPVHTSVPDANYLIELGKIRKNYKHAIGFCGRVAAEKGLEVLIEGMRKEKDTFLFIAGPNGKDVSGEESYFLQIEKKLRETKIPHIFLGTLTGEKLSTFYKAIDILVLPSLNKTEAFGMVQVEAMLQGTPVIASNLPGVRIPIRLTKMGIIIPPNDVQRMEKALQIVLRDRALFTSPLLVQNAKKIFDTQKIYAAIYQVIQNLISF